MPEKEASEGAETPQPDQHPLTTSQMRQRAQKRVQEVSLDWYPKEMSCLDVFGDLMHCMSLPGQIKNYYRFGDFTMCDPEQKKLEFCMGNRGKLSPQKEHNIQQFYKEEAIEKLRRGSSEDVWALRRR